MDRIKKALILCCLSIFLAGLLTACTNQLQVQSEVSTGVGVVSQQSSSHQTSSADKSAFTFTYNKSNLRAESCYRIAGHYWQELSENELSAVFPKLSSAYTISATANYSDGNGLFNIVSRFTTNTGGSANLRVSSKEASADCVIKAEPVVTDLLGVEVTAGHFEESNGMSDIYFAEFSLDNMGYYLEVSSGEDEKSEFENIVLLLIEGGKADFSILNHAAPELRDEKFTIEQAYEDEIFGKYVPKNIPSGFSLISASRFVNQSTDSLTCIWEKGMDEIWWVASIPKETDMSLITKVSDTKNYDMSLYKIPLADSVPKELMEIVSNPIFKIEELTPEAVKARAYKINDAGDTSGCRLNLGVLYDDVLVDITSKGADPEWVYNMLTQNNIK